MFSLSLSNEKVKKKILSNFISQLRRAHFENKNKCVQFIFLKSTEENIIKFNSFFNGIICPP